MHYCPSERQRNAGDKFQKAGLYLYVLLNIERECHFSAESQDASYTRASQCHRFS